MKVKDVKTHQAKVTRPSPEDPIPHDAAPGYLERVRNEGPNEQPLDDTQRGDVDPATAARLGIPVTRVRQYRGYNLCRLTKYGLWIVEGLEEMGTFTAQQEAEKGVDRHLKEQEAP